MSVVVGIVPRAVRHRRGHAAAVGVVSAAITSCFVATAAYTAALSDTAPARISQQSWSAAAGTALLGLVVLWSRVESEVTDRADELRLFRIRGLRRPSRYLLLVAEHSVAITVGCAVGLIAGWATGGVLAGIAVTTVSTASPLIGAVFAYAVITAVTVSACVHADAKVGVVVPPRTEPAISTPALSLGVGLMVVTAVAWYADRGTEQPWSAAVPALLSISLALLCAWSILFGCRWAASRLTFGSQVWLAFVRFGRSRRLLSYAVVLAAGINLAIAGQALYSADQWRTEQAFVQTVGAVSIPSTKSSQTTLRAARTADPNGRWLMAVAGLADSESPEYRRVFVDARAWQRVAADGYAELAPLIRRVTDSAGRPGAVIVAGDADPAATDDAATRGVVRGLDGRDRRARSVGQVDVLPRVGTVGVLGDVRSFGVTGEDPVGTSVAIAARADTPQSVFNDLAGLGIDPARAVPLADAADTLDDPAIDALWLVLVLAAIGMVTAVFAPRGGAPPSDLAALRVTGIRPAYIRRALLLESSLAAVAGGVGVGIASMVGSYLAVSAYALGFPGTWAIAPTTAVSWGIAVGVAGVASIVIALPRLRAVRTVARAQPVVLRSEAR